MCSEELTGHKEVDTLRIGLLSSSLISMIFISYPLSYLFSSLLFHYQELVPGISAGRIFELRTLKTTGIFFFILPQVTSLILWYVMPFIIKKWYTLGSLPPTHGVYDLVQKIASKMDIPPPNILYTQRDVANCFNLGRREGESTIVISQWLLTHLSPDELKAVLAHELAHTKNRDVTLMAYFAAVRWTILLSPLFAISGGCYILFQLGASPHLLLYVPIFWILLAFVILLYILLALGIQWFSRLREAVADARVSLLIDKNILKRALYKFACARTLRMLPVSPCLMISSAHGIGGIFSTHPPVHKRYESLDKEKHIIDTSKPPSLRFCFITACCVFIFTLFIGYLFSILYLFATEQLPQDMPVIFFGPVITAGLLVLHYDYISVKYVGLIIFLIAFVQFLTFFVLVLLNYLIWQYLLPFGVLSAETVLIDVVETSIGGRENLLGLLVELLESRAQFLVITFLMYFFLKYTRKYMKV